MKKNFKSNNVIPEESEIQYGNNQAGFPIELGMTKQKRLIQFLKYWLGSYLEFWSGYGLFAVCYSVFHWWWLWGKLAADIFGWTLNYFVQRYWAFDNPKLKLNEMQHVKRYIFIESIGFVLDYGIIGGLKAIGISPYIGFWISAGFFTIWSYLWYRFWVFPETSGKMIKHERKPNKSIERKNPADEKAA